MFSKGGVVALAILAVLLLGGCAQAPGEQSSQEQQKDAGEDTRSESVPKTQSVPKASESATKIYLGLLQTSLEEAVVDVQQQGVVIGFRQDPDLNDEALVYRAFGLSAAYEPDKEKTTVLIFLPDRKIIEASARNSDITALSKGQLTDSEFKERVHWAR